MGLLVFIGFILPLSAAYLGGKGSGGMKRWLWLLFLYLFLGILLLPLAVTYLCGGFGRVPEAKALYTMADLAEPQTELEAYVEGVVAAEMPVSFPEEALKAQAVAARTYQLRQQQAAGTEEVLYDVGQAYLSQEEQKERWGENYAVYAAKIHRAVQETAGEIMVYDGEPILAAFHAQSAGRTEAAENVWAEALPYLRSVDSSSDADAPQYETEVVFSEKELKKRLGTADLQILSRTAAGYVSEVQAGEKVLTGREVREALGLRSSSFTIKRTAEGILFTTHGYGHGAGMSQYGAAALAKEGKNYHEILRHYYTDVKFTSAA